MPCGLDTPENALDLTDQCANRLTILLNNHNNIVQQIPDVKPGDGYAGIDGTTSKRQPCKGTDFQVSR
jgi:hypothetical protein